MWPTHKVVVESRGDDAPTKRSAQLITQSQDKTNYLIKPLRLQLGVSSKEAFRKVVDALYSGTCSPVEFVEYMGILGEAFGPELLKDVLSDEEITLRHSDAVARFLRMSSQNFSIETIRKLQETYSESLKGMPVKFVRAVLDGTAAGNSPLAADWCRSLSQDLWKPAQAGWMDGLIRQRGFIQALTDIKSNPQLMKLGQNTSPELYVATQALKSGPQAAASYYSALLGTVDPVTVSHAGAQFENEYPKEGMEWLRTLSPPQRATVEAGMLMSVAEKEPDVALDYLRGYGGSKAELIKLLNGLNTAFRNTGQDDWATQITEELVRLDKETTPK